MPAEELTPFFAGTMNKFCPLFAPDSAAIRQFSASRFPPPLRQSRILNVLPPPDGSRNVSMRAGGGAFVSAETYGRGERGVERRGDPRPFPCLTGSGQRKPRRARLPPSPGRGVGLGPPCKHRRACLRNLRKRFSEGACEDDAQRSLAMPEGGLDRLRRTPGPRESEATLYPFPEATLSRGFPDHAFTPAAPVRAASACAENPRKTGLL